jgi:hypothetical protein
MNPLPALLVAGALILSRASGFAGDAAFSLSTGDVGKAVILMWENGHTVLEVTYSKEKQAEFAKIAEINMGQKATIILNGKAVSEITIDHVGGHSLKVEQPSPEAALQLAKSLFKPKP